MYRFIESIRLENHQLQHIEWHNKRLCETRHHFFGLVPDIDLAEALTIPALSSGIYKCRVVYGEQIEEVTIELYVSRQIHSLRLMTDNQAEYTYKSGQRQMFEAYLKKKGDADDILIVKNDCMTDTSFSNVVFFDGCHWYTPDTFLLNGTCRQRLLAEGMIREAHITMADLKRYTQVKLINALIDWKQTPSVSLLY